MTTKRLICEYAGCSKSYCSSFNLKRHIEIVHLGVKKFRCLICGRFLSSKQNLIDHHNIHTGAKPYMCQVPGCGHTFRQLSQFYIHQQVHVGRSSPSTFNFVSSEVLQILSRNLASVLYEKDSFEENNHGAIVLPEICKDDTNTILPLYHQVLNGMSKTL